MRNGVYRVWIKTRSGQSGGVVVFKDGDIFAADRVFAFNGRYSETAGRLTAHLSCKRLSSGTVQPGFPDLDRFRINAKGPAADEFFQLTATIDEAPDFPMSFECAFLCEA